MKHIVKTARLSRRRIVPKTRQRESSRRISYAAKSNSTASTPCQIAQGGNTGVTYALPIPLAGYGHYTFGKRRDGGQNSCSSYVRYRTFRQCFVGSFLLRPSEFRGDRKSTRLN